MPYAPVTIKTDAGPGVLTVLGERANEYPGVVQQPVSIRAYPYGEMAAQVLGYVGDGLKTQLKCRPSAASRGARSSARKGSSTTTTATCAANPGSSASRSTPTATRCPAGCADPAEGRPQPAGDARHAACSRRAKRRSLEGIDNARAGGKPAIAGAFVALDPRNGEVLSIGS